MFGGFRWRVANTLTICLVVEILAGSLAFSTGTKYGSFKDESNKMNQYDDLLRRIEQKNYMLRHSIMGDMTSTRNEVDDDIDYLLDEKAVKRAWARNNLNKKHEDHMNMHFMKQAMKNVDLVKNTAQCNEPTRRCLDVNRMDFGKPRSYWPNCALVHKCAHDSGCCSDPAHVCSPVKTETIELFFFSMDRTSEKKKGGVELLTFENHTLCDCRPRVTNLDEVIRDCDCPRHFSPVVSSSECKCDCDEKQSRPCKRVKRGRRSYHGKGCKGGKCADPVCDFGEFKKEFGRCPRKKREKKNNLV